MTKVFDIAGKLSIPIVAVRSEGKAGDKEYVVIVDSSALELLVIGGHQLRVVPKVHMHALYLILALI